MTSVNQNHIQKMFSEKYKQNYISLIERSNRQCKEFALISTERGKIKIIDGQRGDVSVPIHLIDNVYMAFHTHLNDNECPSTSSANSIIEQIFNKYAFKNFSSMDISTAIVYGIELLLLGYKENGIRYVGYIPLSRLKEYQKKLSQITKRIKYAINKNGQAKALNEYYEVIDSITTRVKL